MTEESRPATSRPGLATLILEAVVTLPNPSLSTYDPTTDVGQVRLLINDIQVPSDVVFTDAEIQAFLTLQSGHIKRAAARALLTLAANEALLAKKITTQDLQTDGPAVAAELRAQAKQLRAEADNDDAASDAGWGFEIVHNSRRGHVELTEPYRSFGGCW